MDSICSRSTLLIVVFIFLSLFHFSTSIDQTKAILEVDLASPVLHFTPSQLHSDLHTSGSHDMSCERVRVVGLSMTNIKSYANSVRVTLTPSVAIPERLHNKIEICLHRNASLGLCECGKDEWKTILNGQWNAFMSPYEDRYVDVKVMGGTSGTITLSIEQEFYQWRLYCLGFGFLLLLVAPIVSDWVPFYYSSSMAVGVLLVVLILMFQGMKLLPTGRKSAFYFTIYGSVLGLGSYLLHYFSVLINSILISFGLSEDMYNPVSITVGVVIVLFGAALGYWAVRTYVISEDGNVDAGIAQFVKWAFRIVATTTILQSTLDPRLAGLATITSWGISAQVQRWCTRAKQRSGSLWMRKPKHASGSKHASGGRKSAEFLSRSAGKANGKTPWITPRAVGTPWVSPKAAIPFAISPTKGYVSASPIKQRDYYSTFGNPPKRRRFSKKEWDAFTTESTKEALAELASSPEFTDWIVENADRIQLEPEDSSDDSMDSGAVSSEETAVENESKRGLFGW